MQYTNSKTYCYDLHSTIDKIVNKENLYNKSVLITGATGLIGSYLVDTLLELNRLYHSCIKIFAIGRNMERLANRFPQKDEFLQLIEHDVNERLEYDIEVDYVIHAASNAFPAAFNNDPVGTLLSNIQGTKNLLDYCKEHNAKRFLFISSGEVYGQGDLSLSAFSEEYNGYVNPVSARSCYPNGKRAAETLCVSYTKQYGIETVIARPCHTYGANVTSFDNRANVQFVRNALEGNKIVLKSAGNQMRSYCYIADCASAIFTILLCGENQNAYNIANPFSKTTIAGFARIVAELSGTSVEFESPDEVALAERTPIAKQVLDSTKLESLGWSGAYNLNEGIGHNLRILKELKNE